MISVVIPTTRASVWGLVRSLQCGSRVPDQILIISDVVGRSAAPGGEGFAAPAEVSIVRFRSDVQPTGVGDAGLRRDIGADLAQDGIVIFQDDDQIAPRTMVETAVTIAEADGFCWGHHRYIDFDEYPPEQLLDLSPEEGRPRELEANRWHGFESSYAGMFAIGRKLFWEVGGFDLAYLGWHGSEDQQLGRRLAHGSQKTYVHEPPFAWHPTRERFHSVPKTNIMESHKLVAAKIDGHPFLVCEECPWRRPEDVYGLTMSEQVVVPYRREQFTLEKERI